MKHGLTAQIRNQIQVLATEVGDSEVAADAVDRICRLLDLVAEHMTCEECADTAVPCVYEAEDGRQICASCAVMWDEGGEASNMERFARRVGSGEAPDEAARAVGGTGRPGTGDAA